MFQTKNNLFILLNCLYCEKADSYVSLNVTATVVQALNSAQHVKLVLYVPLAC